MRTGKYLLKVLEVAWKIETQKEGESDTRKRGIFQKCKNPGLMHCHVIAECQRAFEIFNFILFLSKLSNEPDW